MKPVHNYAPHMTFDLTEGKIHKREDGAIVAFFPKTWEKKERITLTTHDGEMVVAPYIVTSWEEVVISQP